MMIKIIVNWTDNTQRRWSDFKGRSSLHPPVSTDTSGDRGLDYYTGTGEDKRDHRARHQGLPEPCINDLFT